MNIEEIAQLDLFLKNKNGLEHIINIDKLIIIEKDQNAPIKLKQAAYILQDIPNEASEEIKSTWANLFGKQIRYSVNRVKAKKVTD
jgi:hypothetical protein